MDIRQQAITGVIPPETAESMIREMYPSVASVPGLAGLGQTLTRTIVLAPLAWLLMSAVYFGKLLPFGMRRYRLTNRRIMICGGWAGTSVQEVLLGNIDDVRLIKDGNSDFFRAANLEVISGGQSVMTLRGVPDPEPFRRAILATRNAWVPSKTKLSPFLPASAAK